MDRHTKRMPCGDKDRDGVICLPAKNAKMPANYWKLEEQPRTDSLSQPSEGSSAAETFAFGLPAPGTVGKHMPVV